MKNGDAFMYVFSLIAQSTFNDIPDLHQATRAQKERGEVIGTLVGNKCDLEDQRVISVEQGASLANQLGCSYIETSAKLDINVEQAFYDLIRSLWAVRGHPSKHEHSDNGKAKCVVS